MTLNRFPPLPTFDPTKDGNPFAWVIRTAPKVRAERLQRIATEAVAKRVALHAIREQVKP